MTLWSYALTECLLSPPQGSPGEMGEAGPSGEPGIPVGIPIIYTYHELCWVCFKPNRETGARVLLPCTNKPFSNAIGAVLPARHASPQWWALPGSPTLAWNYRASVMRAGRVGTSVHGYYAAAQVKAHQGRRCDLVDGPTGQGVWDWNSLGFGNTFWLCSSLGRVDLWLLNGMADFGVFARVKLVFLVREVCRDPEEQL